MIPIPQYDADYGEPNPQLMRYLNKDTWLEIYSELQRIRGMTAEEAGQARVLIDACQALMCEVGKGHVLLSGMLDCIPERDSGWSDADVIRELEFAFSDQTTDRPGGEAVARNAPASPLGTETLELALQRVLARVDAAPSALSVAEFIDLCHQVSNEVAGVSDEE